MPILPALPVPSDVSFNATHDLPHGREWLDWRRYLWQTGHIRFPEDR